MPNDGTGGNSIKVAAFFIWAELATAQTEDCSALRLFLGVLGKVSASIANGNTKQKENDV